MLLPSLVRSVRFSSVSRSIPRDCTVGGLSMICMAAVAFDDITLIISLIACCLYGGYMVYDDSVTM